jgi:hypothetical protein
VTSSHRGATAGMMLVLHPAATAFMFVLAVLVLGFTATTLLLVITFLFLVLALFLAGVTALLESDGTASSSPRPASTVRAVHRHVAFGMTAFAQALFPGLAAMGETVLFLVGLFDLRGTDGIIFLDGFAAARVATAAYMTTLFGGHVFGSPGHVFHFHRTIPFLRVGGRISPAM